MARVDAGIEAIPPPEAVIVIDSGTSSVKVGFAGEDSPAVVFPTLLIDRHSLSPELFPDIIENPIGHAAAAILESPNGRNITPTPIMESGNIIDLESMTRLWSSLLRDELGVNPKEHHIVITMSPTYSRQRREDIVASLFSLGVRSVSVLASTTAALFSTGRTSGLCIDVGEGRTTVMPIYEGVCLLHAAQYSSLFTGSQATDALQQNLHQHQIKFSSQERWIVRQIKGLLLSFSLSLARTHHSL